jgi:hypothetical protein
VQRYNCSKKKLLPLLLLLLLVVVEMQGQLVLRRLP